MHGGKTGQDLSQAVRDRGHDGIVTYDKDGPSEIVDLTHLKPQAGGSEHHPQVTHQAADPRERLPAQLSWESAPGKTTHYMPEFHDAPLEQRREYQKAVEGVLADDKGEDILAKTLGLRTGPTFSAAGVFQGRVNPGAQAQVVGDLTDNDKQKVNASEAVRGILLRQDATAWHKPENPEGHSDARFAEIDPEKANMVDFRMGRPVDEDETRAIDKALSSVSGLDYALVPTEKGWRVLNTGAMRTRNSPALCTRLSKASKRIRLGKLRLYTAII